MCFIINWILLYFPITPDIRWMIHFNVNCGTKIIQSFIERRHQKIYFCEGKKHADRFISVNNIKDYQKQIKKEIPQSFLNKILIYLILPSRLSQKINIQNLNFSTEQKSKYIAIKPTIPCLRFSIIDDRLNLRHQLQSVNDRE